MAREPPPAAGDSHAPPDSLACGPMGLAVAPRGTQRTRPRTHRHVTACTPLRYPGSCAPHHTHPAAAHFVSARPLPPCRPTAAAHFVSARPLPPCRPRQTSKVGFVFRLFASLVSARPVLVFVFVVCIVRSRVSFSCHRRARPPRGSCGVWWSRFGYTVSVPDRRSRHGHGWDRGGGRREGRKEGRDCVCSVRGIRFMKP